MAKPKTLHVCQSCAYESTKWMGKCPSCDAWNTFVEEVREKSTSSSSTGSSARAGYGAAIGSEPLRLKDVEISSTERIQTGVGELDRVLGGGFVAGGVVMLGGDPGIGKSTISLQVAGTLANMGLEVLYISGEESLGQIKLRADRLGVDATDLWIVAETSLERCEEHYRERKPDFVVIDSIQTLVTERLSSSPGSVAQLREVTGTITQLAKGLGVSTVLVGHVTKDGAIAGPKVLEHMVDTVLYFEAQAGAHFRLLRAVKNRFGSTNEVGVFEMRSDGLHEVPNPSAAFLDGRPSGASGSVVLPIIEGTRPLMVEIQALVSPNNYGPPRVTALGFDSNRVILLLNIIEKRTGLKVAGMDVFVNVTGGVRVVEPAADLGIIVAVLSSFFDRAVPDTLTVFGEVGLTGEVRAVSQAEHRLQESHKLGFERAVTPRISLKHADEMVEGLRIDEAATVTDAVRHIFGADALARNRSSDS